MLQSGTDNVQEAMQCGRMSLLRHPPTQATNMQRCQGRQLQLGQRVQRHRAVKRLGSAYLEDPKLAQKDDPPSVAVLDLARRLSEWLFSDAIHAKVVGRMRVAVVAGVARRQMVVAARVLLGSGFKHLSRLLPRLLLRRRRDACFRCCLQTWGGRKLRPVRLVVIIILVLLLLDVVLAVVLARRGRHMVGGSGDGGEDGHGKSVARPRRASPRRLRGVPRLLRLALPGGLARGAAVAPVLGEAEEPLEALARESRRPPQSQHLQHLALERQQAEEVQVAQLIAD